MNANARKAAPVLGLLILIAAAPAPATDWGVDLYGRSYHHNLPPGERDRLNEANIGFALWTEAGRDRHVFKLDAGTYLNSYYDSTYWIGGQYRYRWFKHLEPGLMMRHWETAHDTYPDKLLNKYLTVTIPVNDRFAVSAITKGDDGAIFYATLHFH